MFNEIYPRQLTDITGNGAAGTIITRLPTDKRIHAFCWKFTYTGGTNTLAGAVAAITNIRIKVGTTVKSELSATQLRDYLLLNGTAYDFEGSAPNTTGVLMYFPFAEPWFLSSLADRLAWNPQRLGGEISIEIVTAATAATIAPYALVSDDVNVPSAGIITQQVITPVSASTDYIFTKEIEPRGRLIQASIYPDAGGSNAPTAVIVYGGSNKVILHDELSLAQVQELVSRYGMTPTASGRTANVYDIVPVRGDMLSHGYDLRAWMQVAFRIKAGGAMSGTQSILLARVETDFNTGVR